MPDELVYQIALELIPGVGHRGVKNLMGYCGAASAVFSTTKSKLLKIPGVGQKMVEAIKTSRPLKAAESIIFSTEKLGAEILHYTHEDFPKRLKQIPDSPTVIYKKGNGDLNPKRSVAIVGTRKATDYGKSVTEKIVDDLASMNVTVISGLAYGIDIQAHKACLKNEISTYAVLAGGLDFIYPSIHKKYVEEIMGLGGIISENIPGTQPDSHLFPARNRIIAGMVDAVIVVEAALKGGALITAHLADSYDRTVFAVPGDLGRRYSKGTNELIVMQRALIYTGIEDLIYHLNWTIRGEDRKSGEVAGLSEPELSIYELLSSGGQSMEIDMIAVKTQIPIHQVPSHLLSLEFKHLVKSLPGKKYGLIT